MELSWNMILSIFAFLHTRLSARARAHVRPSEGYIIKLHQTEIAFISIISEKDFYMIPLSRVAIISIQIFGRFTENVLFCSPYITLSLFCCQTPRIMLICGTYASVPESLLMNIRGRTSAEQYICSEQTVAHELFEIFHPICNMVFVLGTFIKLFNSQQVTIWNDLDATQSPSDAYFNCYCYFWTLFKGLFWNVLRSGSSCFCFSYDLNYIAPHSMLEYVPKLLRDESRRHQAKCNENFGV